MSAEAIISNIALSNLSLLRESDLQLKAYALQQLHKNVDYCWHQISEHIQYIEELYEDETFPQRQLAASLASKVYYNLEDYDEALDYALKSGDYFSLDNEDLYTQQIISKCVNTYIEIRKSNYEIVDTSGHVKINQKLEEIVQRLFDKCLNEKEYKQALGISIESRKIDEVKRILDLCRAQLDILNYLFEITQKIVSSKKFKNEILRIIVSYSKQNPNKQPQDYLMISQCLYKLDDYASLATIIEELAQSNNNNLHVLVAFQIASDIYDNDNQHFILHLLQEIQNNALEYPHKNSLLELLEGKFQRKNNLEFSSLFNKTDPQIIKNYKDIVDTKQSVPHLGVIVTNALHNVGTLNDNFLRDNLEWVGKCSHWSKFTTTASLGVIHKGNTAKAKEILNPYFPGQMATPNWHTHGGSLYGLGLVYGGIKHQDTINYLIDTIKNPTYNSHEEIINGACLGIGLTAFASADMTLYEELKNVLFTDSAVTGEAAALGIGLIMVGTQNEEIIQELLTYAHETQHEKIIRSVAISLAVIMFGREEGADTLIESLLLEKDALLRFGGMYMMGMAYIGTGNNKILKKLLHYAVSDVSDDVRKAAVISLGFLLLKDYEQVPKILNLLGLSFNPHVRYGAAIALGISCSGTLLQDAINMLEPLLNDNIDFVRQGAFVALSMVIHQANSTLEPKVEKLRENIKEVITKKNEDPLCKLGAFIASGLLDVGGRNSQINLLSQTGNPKTAACVGMLLFTQFWYWFPYSHFISLAINPSALIGVREDLKIPKSFEFISNTNSTLYDYPDPVKPYNQKDQSKKETVSLSTTARVKARANLRRGEMEVEKETTPAPDKIEEEKEKPKEEEQKKEEKPFILYSNPARILQRQSKYVTYPNKNRYQPIFPERKRGYVFLNDTNPSAEDQYFPQYIKDGQKVNNQQQPAGDTKLPKGDTVPPPEPFIFDETTQTEQK